ncbi:hypothetical protein TPAR_06552 [Tolypocladium paradoxum]|uniref:Uncharacterized protein n=1 Tax=Tolypocladium paradoxum TaxID=94208 RepID=A0A2S4KST2_9HYPO|nr:hypothetical protein TPAR_06552 [Tolypocladium paradoxum]
MAHIPSPVEQTPGHVSTQTCCEALLCAIWVGYLTGVCDGEQACPALNPAAPVSPVPSDLYRDIAPGDHRSIAPSLHRSNGKQGLSRILARFLPAPVVCVAPS